MGQRGGLGGDPGTGGGAGSTTGSSTTGSSTTGGGGAGGGTGGGIIGGLYGNWQFTYEYEGTRVSSNLGTLPLSPGVSTNPVSHSIVGLSPYNPTGTPTVRAEIDGTITVTANWTGLSFAAPAKQCFEVNYDVSTSMYSPVPGMATFNHAVNDFYDGLYSSKDVFDLSQGTRLLAKRFMLVPVKGGKATMKFHLKAGGAASGNVSFALAGFNLGVMPSAREVQIWMINPDTGTKIEKWYEPSPNGQTRHHTFKSSLTYPDKERKEIEFEDLSNIQVKSVLPAKKYNRWQDGSIDALTDEKPRSSRTFRGKATSLFQPVEYYSFSSYHTGDSISEFLPSGIFGTGWDIADLVSHPYWNPGFYATNPNGPYEFTLGDLDKQDKITLHYEWADGLKMNARMMWDITSRIADWTVIGSELSGPSQRKNLKFMQVTTNGQILWSDYHQGPNGTAVTSVPGDPFFYKLVGKVLGLLEFTDTKMDSRLKYSLTHEGIFFEGNNEKQYPFNINRPADLQPSDEYVGTQPSAEFWATYPENRAVILANVLWTWKFDQMTERIYGYGSVYGYDGFLELADGVRETKTKYENSLNKRVCWDITGVVGARSGVSG